VYVIANAVQKSNLALHAGQALKHIVDLDAVALGDRLGYLFGDVKANAVDIVKPAVVVFGGKALLNWLGISVPAWVAGK